MVCIDELTILSGIGSLLTTVPGIPQSRDPSVSPSSKNKLAEFCWSKGG